MNAIFPRHVAPVVRHAPDGEREIVTMTWGFLRLEKGRAPKPVNNVRDDQIQRNPFWRDSFRQRRCLVPASSFCEPKGDVKPATWNWFAINGQNECVVVLELTEIRPVRGSMIADQEHTDRIRAELKEKAAEMRRAAKGRRFAKA